MKNMRSSNSKLVSRATSFIGTTLTHLFGKLTQESLWDLLLSTCTLDHGRLYLLNCPNFWRLSDEKGKYFDPSNLLVITCNYETWEVKNALNELISNMVIARFSIYSSSQEENIVLFETSAGKVSSRLSPTVIMPHDVRYPLICPIMRRYFPLIGEGIFLFDDPSETDDVQPVYLLDPQFGERNSETIVLPHVNSPSPDATLAALSFLLTSLPRG